MSAQERETVATGARTSVGYLKLIMLGHKTPSADKARAIEIAAARIGVRILRSDLRPETFS